MYAKLTIVGNLGRDPELRYTADGTPVCSFSVATSRRVPDGQNGYKEVPTWWRVTTWRKLAENCQRFLAKGRRVLVEAEVVKAHGYKTRDGEVAASLEITADRVVFLSSREEGSGSPSARPGARDERLGDLSPLAVHPEWDTADVDRAVAYQLRWVEDRTTCREIYSLDENDRDWYVFTERLVGGHWEATRDKTRWPYPWSPVIHGKNLPNPNEFFGLSDLEQDALSLAASINFVASNINRIQRLFAHPIPWGYGFAQKDLSVEPGKAILAGTEKAALQYLQMASDPSAQGFLQFLVQSFYEIVRVPEMNPGEVQMGAQSGFALRILYSDLLEKTQTKRRLYGEVLEEVSRRALEMMGHGRDVEVSIDWQEPLPIMETEQASALGFDLSTGIVSKETVANRRGYDYGVEQEKIKAERQEAAQQEMNLGALALANYEQGKTGGLLPLSGGAQGLPGGLGELQTPIQAVPGGKPQ